MILTEKQLGSLSKDSIEKLIMVLYKIEDELDYKCKKVSKTIDYIQHRYSNNLDKESEEE